mmetsp:Transcript_28759/g.83413  ORF Transcript_28759/g.83413 Transcript_28759/m.83413 type:complete len:808 (+) Transcript_28759:421-2844(+)
MKDELLHRGQQSPLFLTPCLEIISLLVTAGEFGKNITLNGRSLGRGLGGFLLGSGSGSSGLLGLLLLLSGLFFVFTLLLLNTSPGLLLGLSRKGHGSLNGRKSDFGLLLLVLESRNDELFLLNLEPTSSGTLGKLWTTVVAVAVTRSATIASSAISVGAAASTSPVAVASRATATLIAVSTKASSISKATSTTSTTLIAVTTKASGTSKATSVAVASAKATLFGCFSLTLGPLLGGNIVLVGSHSGCEPGILRHGRALVHTSGRTTAIPAAWRASHITAAHHIATVTITIPLGTLFLLPLALHLKFGGSCGKARILLHGWWAHVARRRPGGSVKVGRGSETRVGRLRRTIKVPGRSALGALGVVGLGGRCEARVLHLGWRTTGGRFGTVGGTSLLALAIALLLLFGKGGKALVADNRGRTVATGAASSLAIITAFRAFVSAGTGSRGRGALEHGSTAVHDLGLTGLPLPALALFAILLIIAILFAFLGLAICLLFSGSGILLFLLLLGSLSGGSSSGLGLHLLLLFLLLSSLGGGGSLFLTLLHLEVKLLELLGSVHSRSRAEWIGLRLGLGFGSSGRHSLDLVLDLDLLDRCRPLGQIETRTGGRTGRCSSGTSKVTTTSAAASKVIPRGWAAVAVSPTATAVVVITAPAVRGPSAISTAIAEASAISTVGGATAIAKAPAASAGTVAISATTIVVSTPTITTVSTAAAAVSVSTATATISATRAKASAVTASSATAAPGAVALGAGGLVAAPVAAGVALERPVVSLTSGPWAGGHIAVPGGTAGGAAGPSSEEIAQANLLSLGHD